MFEEYDKVEYKPTGETCFVIVVDEDDEGDVLYGLELEDQEKRDWFRWCNENEISLIER